MAGVGHTPSGNFSAVRILRDMDGDGAETELEGQWRTHFCRYSWVRDESFLLLIH